MFGGGNERERGGRLGKKGRRLLNTKPLSLARAPPPFHTDPAGFQGEADKQL